jgi:hypothetical protein
VKTMRNNEDSRFLIFGEYWKRIPARLSLCCSPSIDFVLSALYTNSPSSARSRMSVRLWAENGAVMDSSPCSVRPKCLCATDSGIE